MRSIVVCWNDSLLLDLVQDIMGGFRLHDARTIPINFRREARNHFVARAGDLHPSSEAPDSSFYALIVMPPDESGVWPVFDEATETTGGEALAVQFAGLSNLQNEEVDVIRSVLGVRWSSNQRWSSVGCLTAIEWLTLK
jgi:hypothetical protein